METKFNFKSQVCTDRFQSERLLALGLKKETADMVHTYLNRWDGYHIHEHDWSDISCDEQHIPAWSLARLVELMPQSIDYEDNSLYFTIYAGDVFYSNWKEHTPVARTLNLYEHLIWYIEWLIKEGYFNKEYLV